MATRTKFTATCVQRLHQDPDHAWTHYRISGRGIPAQSDDKHYKDVIASASSRWVKYGERPEVHLFAADKDGKPVRTASGALIQLWGGGRGDLSASRALKEAGATKVIPCAQVSRSPLDGRRRRVR
jgi:hypothetical protein